MKQVNIFCCALLILFLCAIGNLTAQGFYKEQHNGWFQKAEESKPTLIETIKQPIAFVALVKDENAFRHCKAVRPDSVESFYRTSFKKEPGVVLDFDEQLLPCMELYAGIFYKQVS